jgi:outer membrane lipoprotein carrier protein
LNESGDLRSSHRAIGTERKAIVRIPRSPDHPITRFLLLALLPLAVTPAPMPTANSDMSAALSRVAALYADGAAHAAPFAQTYTPAGFATARRETGTIWIQAPQRLRFEYTGPEKKVFTYDAGEGRLFTPEDRQLTIRKLSAEERSRLPIIFLSDPSELERQYAITLEPGDGGGSRALLTPRSPRPDLSWLRLSIAADGTIQALAYEDSSGSRSEFRFEAWRKEKPRPTSDYRITGPPGTRVLEN